jgi:hypothetical protein
VRLPARREVGEKIDGVGSGAALRVYAIA